MALSVSPKRVKLIARELALLRALAADRRQASWLALLRAREGAAAVSYPRGGSGAAQVGTRRNSETR
jgi:hypothetical protein